jgi:hypothetical protein
MVNPRVFHSVTTDYGMFVEQGCALKGCYQHRAAYEALYGWPADPNVVWQAREAEREARAKRLVP